MKARDVRPPTRTVPPLPGVRRDITGPTALVLPELATEIEASTTAIRAVDAGEELFEAHSEYAEASVTAAPRPNLDPERVTDGALLEDFRASRRRVDAMTENLAEAKARREEAEAALADVPPPPASARIAFVKIVVVLLGLLAWFAAAGFMAIGLEDGVLRGALGSVLARSAIFVVAIGFALLVAGSVIWSMATATLLANGRVSLASKVTFIVFDLLYAASFLAVRLGQGEGETNWWAQVAWSGLELVPIVFYAAALAVVGPVLKRAVKARAVYEPLAQSLRRHVAAEAGARAELAEARADALAIAGVVQEREEAECEERAIVTLAKKTSDLAVLRGLARNREQANGGVS